MGAAVLGMCCGLLGMISAPGVRNRSLVKREGEYTGFVGLLSRTYKVSMSVRDLFFTLFVILLIVLALLVVCRGGDRYAEMKALSFGRVPLQPVMRW